MSAIGPLRLCRLCLDCEAVFADPVEHTRCPGCGSAIIMPLARWLDRERKEEEVSWA